MKIRTIVCLFWFVLLVIFNVAVSISLPRPYILSSATKKVHPSFGGTNYKESIERDLRRFMQGIKGFIALLSDAGKVEKKKKEKGLSSLSFSEYSLLETRNEDISKLLRIIIYIPLSPELFFYSSILLPFIGLNKSPWIWQSYPSSFSYKDEFQSRREILGKRRMQLLVNSFSWLKNNVIDDMNDAYRRFVVGEDIERIEKAIQSPSLASSLQTLEPLYLATDTSSVNKLIKKKKLDANLSGFPAWSVLKEMCRSIGTDGLPNIIFLRRFNRGEIIKYVNKIRKDDEFIDQIGIKALSNNELLQICHDRFISIEGKTDTQLRKSLSTWMDHTVKSFEKQVVEHGRCLENEQNKRLVLMGLNLYEDFKTHPFAETYRKLLK